MKRTQTRSQFFLPSILGGIVAAAVLTTAVFAYPSVFPTGVTIKEPGVYEGYMLYSSSIPGPPGVFVMQLVDLDGNVVHSWGTFNGLQFRPLGPGLVIGLKGGNLVTMDWDNNIVLQIAQPADVLFHHDQELLPNGNILAIASEEVLDLNISDQTLTDDILLELEPDGDVVWEWRTRDHFDEFGFSQEIKDEIYVRGGDWAHANAAYSIPLNTSHADPRFRPGNIVMSYRSQDAVIIIDRDTSEIVWVSLEATAGQHDAHMLPDDVPGGGKILVFDNGWNGVYTIPTRWWSRIKELDPANDATGNSTVIYDATYGGEFQDQFFSPIISSAQRMPNGNTLINEGTKGRIFEVTPEGQTVWEYVHPADPSGSRTKRLVYRAYKLPYEWASSFFAPDLTVSGSGDLDPVTSGDPLTYTIQLVNVGSDPAVNAQLSEATPAFTKFQSITAPADWDCATPAVGGTGSIICTASSFSSGAVADFSISLSVDYCTPDAALIVFEPTALSDGNDATPGDNTTTINTLVEGVDCNDDSLCTTDSCDEFAQECVNDPVVCVPIDSCHGTGTCDPGTGLCSSPALPDGTICDDGDPATCYEECDGGVCSGGSFVPEPSEINDSVTVSHDAGSTTIAWNDPASSYNAYRGTIVPGLDTLYDHACMNPGGALTAMETVDPDAGPAPGTAYYYLITRLDECRESGSGFDTEGVPRDNPHVCPDTGS